MKKALIFGVSGQDGAYLAKLLLSKKYKVYGVSRDLEANNFSRLRHLNVIDDIELISGKVSDFKSVMRVLQKSDPDEVYNLSGQSSVSLSFEQPVETIESIIMGTQNLLDGIRLVNSKIKLFNSCSTECFGDTGDDVADELTAFNPKSPYSVAKSSAFWQVANYRDAYGIFACSGIMSNHESPLRPERFVTQKVISSACRIYQGSSERLYLGNLDVERHWGWAPEYVEAMWLMLQHSVPLDFIIATEKSTPLKEIVEKTFSFLDLDYTEYLFKKSNLLRPSDYRVSRVTPAKAGKILGWHAHVDIDDIVSNLVKSKLSREYMDD